MRVTTSVIPTQVLTFSSGLRLRGERGSTSCIHCIGGQSLQKKFDENLRIMPGSQDKGQEQPEEEAQLPVFRPKMLGKVVVGSVGFEPTTSRAPGLQGTSQAAKRRPGKPAALHDASRRLAHDPVARSEHTISIKRVRIDRLALLQKCGLG